MGSGARVAVAAATGYLLGRTKKLKLAIAVAGLLAGKRIATNPKDVLKQANEYVGSNPELAALSDQLRTKLVEAARGAAITTASSRIDRLSDAIHDRTELLQAGKPRLPGESAKGEKPAEEEETTEERPGEGEEVAEAEQPVEEEPVEEPEAEQPVEEEPVEEPVGEEPVEEEPAKKPERPRRRAGAAKKASPGRRAGTGQQRTGTRSRPARQASSSRANRESR